MHSLGNISAMLNDIAMRNHDETISELTRVIGMLAEDLDELHIRLRQVENPQRRPMSYDHSQEQR